MISTVLVLLLWASLRKRNSKSYGEDYFKKDTQAPLGVVDYTALLTDSCFQNSPWRDDEFRAGVVNIKTGDFRPYVTQNKT